MLPNPKPQTNFQSTLWPVDWPYLRYVIKLHRASTLHYDFRLEMCGWLFSLVTYEPPSLLPNRSILAKQVPDHDPRWLLGERRIPDGKYGAGPMLVWDYGRYMPHPYSKDSHEAIASEALAHGILDFELSGCRLQGCFRLERAGKDWRLRKLADQFARTQEPQWDSTSVLSGRSLDDIEDSVKRHILWLEWQRFYVDPHISEPQVVVRDRHVLDANLPAYEKGIVPGMDLPTVRNLAPDCIRTPWREEDFRECQHRWLDLCVPFSGEIEPIDGHIAALDLSSHPQPLDIARRLIQLLQGKIGLPLRYGVASTKWLARLAARQNELQYAIRNPQAFLEPLPIQDLLPVQQAHRDRLATLGYHKIGQLAKVPLETLRGQFGDDALTISLATEGKILERVQAAYPPDTLHEHLLFEGPVDDALMVDSALEQVAGRLGKRIAGRQASDVQLEIDVDSDGAESVASSLLRSASQQNISPSLPVRTSPTSLTEERGLGFVAHRTLFPIAERARATDSIEPQVQTSRRRFTRPCHDASTILAALRALRKAQPTNKAVLSVHVTLSGIQFARAEKLNLCVSRPNANVDRTLKSLQNVFGEDTIKLASQVKISRRERVLKEWRDASGWH